LCFSETSKFLEQHNHNTFIHQKKSPKGLSDYLTFVQLLDTQVYLEYKKTLEKQGPVIIKAPFDEG
jgi:hypothetical protein